jgi:hypothetical protein
VGGSDLGLGAMSGALGGISDGTGLGGVPIETDEFGNAFKNVPSENEDLCIFENIYQVLFSDFSWLIWHCQLRVLLHLPLAS